MAGERELTEVPVVRTGMLIRRPVGEVFEAFVNPAVTTRFWFTRSSGRLEQGREVCWEWEMYGASTQVRVLAFEPDQRILIEWDGPERPTTVEWRFADQGDSTTFVEIVNQGFIGSADELVQQAMDSTQGFTLVLAGLKALLEHNIALNLVPDRYPAGLAEH